MSGGHYRDGGCDYAYYQVRNFADQVREEVMRYPPAQIAPRLAFAALLSRVSDAMRELDYVDSGDTSWEPKALEHFDKLLGTHDRLEAAIEQANEVWESLRLEIERAKAVQP